MWFNKNYKYYGFGYSNNNYFYRSDKYNKFLKYDEINQLVEENFNDLIDVYATKWSMDEDGKTLSGMYFDIDSDNPADALYVARKVYDYLISFFQIKQPKLIATIFSGAKGFHIELSDYLFGLTEDHLLAEYYKYFAKRMAKDLDIEGFIDYRVYERKRLWRLEKTVNSKTMLFCHRLSRQLFLRGTIDDIIDYCRIQQDYPLFLNPRKDGMEKQFIARRIFNDDYAKFVKWFNENNEKKISVNKLSLANDELPPCLINVLSSEIPEGYRNNTLYVIARALNKLYNLDRDSIYDFVINWCVKNGISDYEAYSTINSACNSEEEFGCMGGSMINYLLNEGVVKCPFVHNDFVFQRLLKTMLCPVYRSYRSDAKVNQMLNKYTTTIKDLYLDLNLAYKEKRWSDAREILDKISIINEKIIGGI